MSENDNTGIEPIKPFEISALRVFGEMGCASIALLQRRTGKTYPFCAHTVDRLKKLGFIKSAGDGEKLELCVTAAEIEKMFGQKRDEEDDIPALSAEDDLPDVKRVREAVFVCTSAKIGEIERRVENYHIRYSFCLPDGFSISDLRSVEKALMYELCTSLALHIEPSIVPQYDVSLYVTREGRPTPSFEEAVSSDEFKNAKGILPVVIGADASGRFTVEDLAKLPHLLITGQEGSGVTNTLSQILLSAAERTPPDELRFIFIDPEKRLSIWTENCRPFMLVDYLIENVRDAVSALKWLGQEMEERYSMFSHNKVFSIEKYNALPPVKSGSIKPMPRIVTVIPELADLMLSKRRRSAEESIKVLCAKARAAGIHVVACTRKVCPEVITGTLKCNFSARIALRQVSAAESRIAIDEAGAENLAGSGDMLYCSPVMMNAVRLQSAYVDDGTLIGRLKGVSPAGEPAKPADELREFVEKEPPAPHSDGAETAAARLKRAKLVHGIYRGEVGKCRPEDMPRYDSETGRFGCDMALVYPDGEPLFLRYYIAADMSEYVTDDGYTLAYMRDYLDMNEISKRLAYVTMFGEAECIDGRIAARIENNDMYAAVKKVVGAVVSLSAEDGEKLVADARTVELAKALCSKFDRDIVLGALLELRTGKANTLALAPVLGIDCDRTEKLFKELVSLGIAFELDAAEYYPSTKLTPGLVYSVCIYKTK